MKRWLLAGAYLWSTLALAGCNAACAARDITTAWNRSHPITPKPSDSPAPIAPEKPSILLRVMPQVCLAPCEVRFTILVNDPGHVLRCPEFRGEFGETEGGWGRKQDCPPAPEVMDGYALNVKNHVFREPGLYVVTVSVLVEGNVVLMESARVLVAGPDEDPNSRDASL